jgi:hypothetical protein
MLEQRVIGIAVPGCGNSNQQVVHNIDAASLLIFHRRSGEVIRRATIYQIARRPPLFRRPAEPREVTGGEHRMSKRCNTIHNRYTNRIISRITPSENILEA